MIRTKSSKPRLRLKIACFRPTIMANLSKGYLPKYWERTNNKILKNLAWRFKNKHHLNFYKNQEIWVYNRVNLKICYNKIMDNHRAIITPRNLILALVQNQFFWTNRRNLFSKIHMHNMPQQTRLTSLRTKVVILKINSNNRAQASIS